MTLVAVSMDKGSSWLPDDVDELRFNLNLIISLDFKFFDLKSHFKFEICAWLLVIVSFAPIRAPWGGLFFCCDERQERLLLALDEVEERARLLSACNT